MELKTCKLDSCITVNQEDNVLAISKLLRETKSRYVYVVDGEEFPIGIISVTDINNRCVAEEKDPKSSKAADIMTQPIDYVEDCDAVEKAYQIMVEKNISSVPVIAEKKIIGVIDFSEVLDRLAKQFKPKNE